MAVWDHLAKLAEQRAPGTKVTALIREAIHKTYFGDDPNGGTVVPSDPTIPSSPYRLQEITALRAAEEPKKSRTQ